jgi:hypothetical chaperone protein
MRPISGGIDFGTSNSTVGIVANGKPRLIALEAEQVTLPSAVFFNFEDNRTYYGRRAIEDYTAHTEGRLMRALKSVLGTSLIHEKTRVKTRSVAFSDILGGFVGHLKRRLEEARGNTVDHVVLGRPVHFVDEDAAADAEAERELEKVARAQGFRNVAFQFEPIAAALDYEQSVQGEELALIADIGGGTSDFSIIRVSPNRAKAAERRDDILANAGVHVGGTDFDRLLSVDKIMPELGYLTSTKDGKRNLPVSYFFDLATWQRINLLYSNKAMTELRQMRYEAARPELVDRMIDIVRHRQGHALAAIVEGAKVAMTSQGESKIALELTEERLDVPVDPRDLDRAIAGAVERIGETVAGTIRDAGLTPSRIGTIFLTGGSTAIGLVRRQILRSAPEARVVDGDMFGSVGLGLALDAERKFA